MKNYLSLVKFSHTIFALPFALLGYFMALQFFQRAVDWKLLGLVVLCMVFARSAAMAFNRYIDRDIDRQNERTAQREIPAGVISKKNALVFILFNCALFVLTTYFINPLCFYLSPVALFIVLGYSYTKRFTAWCHFVLGLGLALAPIGAYLTVSSRFDLIPLLYSAVVLLWVSGFDIIYALQDEKFDKSLQLHSVPVALGTKQALKLSTGLHFCCALVIIFANYQLQLQIIDLEYLHWIGLGIFVFLLAYQHFLLSPNDLSKVNLAFFTTNGLAAVFFVTFVILDFYY